MTYPRRTRVGWGRFATLATLVVLALFGAAAAGADPPVFSNVPASVTIEATSASGATHSYTTPDAADSGGNPIGPVNCAPASGDTFAIGATTVTCSATDTGSGDTATATFTVTVQDTQGPVLSLPGSITQPAASAAGAVVNYTASAVDAVVGAVTVSCTPESDTPFALGATTVNCGATDGTNSSAGAFTVTVSDMAAPTVSVSGPSSATTTNPAGVAVTYTAAGKRQRRCVSCTELHTVVRVSVRGRHDHGFVLVDRRSGQHRKRLALGDGHADRRHRSGRRRTWSDEPDHDRAGRRHRVVHRNGKRQRRRCANSQLRPRERVTVPTRDNDGDVHGS